MRSQGLLPKTITVDGYAASHRTVRKVNVDQLLPADTTLRASKYLHNLIEQDHMLGFKRIGDAAITMSGVELMNRKRQFLLT